MKKQIVVLSLYAVLFALCYSASAQQPAKIPRIGWLSNLRFSEIPNRVEAFRQGLRELGYVEGKNIVIEWCEGNNHHVPALAAELVRLKVDVIVSGALSLTRAAKVATSTIPIVMAQDPDPVGNGFVASLASDFNRPGPCAGVKRGRDRRAGAEGQASIPRRANSGGFRDGI